MNSSRGLIKSMLLIGGAQAISIMISLARMKVLAVLVGPAGIGLLGIYNSLQSTVGTVAGLGLANSGVRELASVNGNASALARVRVILLAAHLIQGAVAMALVWTWRMPIAEWLMGDTAKATEVGLVGVAILLGMIASSQTALLQGLRRIADLGRVTVIGAFCGTIVGLCGVWLQGEAGLIWFLLAQPLTAVLVAFYFTRKLPRPVVTRLTPLEVWNIWRPMAALGAVFMVAGLASAITLLVVRSLIARDLGLDAAGLFSASWGITMTYVGFLLGAMSADYYPRLTGMINDRPAATRLINDQAQLGLALGGPLLLLLIGLAPWLMTLLYSDAFVDAAPMLQWQTVGNVFKLASWPLGFVLVAAARSRAYLFAELTWNSLFIGLIWLGLPLLGLEIAGVAFLLCYVTYFALLCVLVSRLHDFRWERLSLLLICAHGSFSVALLILSSAAPAAGAIASILLALVAGLMGLRIVLKKMGPGGRIAGKLAAVFTAIHWPIKGMK